MRYCANTILLTTWRGSTYSLAYHARRGPLFLSLLLFALCASLLYGGYRLGVQAKIDARLADIAELRSQADSQRELLQGTRLQAQNDLDALTLRLGRMQAQMLRLDALGVRLVSQAGLDEGEFDFGNPPPIGGPFEPQATQDMQIADFLATLTQLDTSLEDRSGKLEMLEHLLMFRDLHDRALPSGRVVRHGLVSSDFGKRIDPFTGKLAWHEGVDITGKLGTDVLALADGIIIWSGERAGYGELVEIDHGNGYITRYAHNQELLAAPGATVRKGDRIALLGSTGRSTGPHVHVEVLHDGKHVNPAKFLQQN